MGRTRDSASLTGLLRGYVSQMNGTEPTPLRELDILCLANSRKLSPEPHQPENWRLARGRWHLVQRLPSQSALPMLEAALVPGPTLLGSLTDRATFESFEAQPAQASLALIEPDVISWSISAGPRGNRRTQARFRLNGGFYDLSVTEPVFESRLAGLRLGNHPRAAAGIGHSDRLLLTVSLGDPFGNSAECFKLIAEVIVLPAERR